ncbi:MAG: DUF4097 family beta strand repeat-containing protein [Candidatus Saccharicenans sp.]|nr:DUF4097 domain-containing protein [Candidatus Saccharicenans sp.]MDH7575337.1 DUF4097 family beta strand repeat-containing protein [Candidatus Saccharicenans sp.]
MATNMTTKKTTGLSRTSHILGLSILLMMTLVFSAGCQDVIEATYKYEEPFSQTIAVKEPGSFSLSNINGSITVTSAPAMEVVIKATKHARWRKEDLNKIRIDIVSGEKSVIVDTIHEKRNLQVKVDYEITLPENMALELVKTVNGRVSLSGKFERAQLRTTNGSITARGDVGWLEAATTNGSLDITQVRGKASLKTTNGSIKLELDEITADLEARTTNGSITIRLKNQPNGYFSARTTNGSVRVDFPVTVEGSLSRRRVEGRMGNGQGPRIELLTTNGSISLNRL